MSLLDPWILMFLNQAVIIGVFIYSFFNGDIAVSHFLYIFACWSFFVIGLNSFYRKKVPAVVCRTLLSASATKLALKIYMALFLLNGMTTFYLMGVPFFTAGNRLLVEYAKLGPLFGVLSYLNIGLQIVINLLAIKAWLADGFRRLAFLGFLVVLIFNILNGAGKGAPLEMIMNISLGLYYAKRNYNINIKFPAKLRKFLFLIPLYILFSFSGAVASGYESNVFFAFIRRVIGAAEGPYYYFILNSYTGFHGLNIISYHLSNVAPYLGYIDRNAIDLGLNLTLFSDLHFGTPGFGPNPTIYVIGHIALGNWGVIYCFLIGCILSFFRYKMKTSFFMWMLLNTLAISLLADGTLMPLYLFYILVLSPVIFISVIMTDRSIEFLNHSTTQQRDILSQ